MIKTSFRLLTVIAIYLFFALPAYSNPDTTGVKSKDSAYKFVDDDPIISMLDSLITLKGFATSNFTTDRSKLNIYGFPSDSIPKFDDIVYQERMSRLNAKSPFTLVYNDAVRKYIDVYAMRKRELVERLLGQSQLYFPLFEETLARYNLPIELKYLAIVESALNPLAKSKSGAMGLWQFMYQTGKQYNLDVNSYIDNRCDPYQSTVAACEYFKYLYDMFGDWQLVLAAYNGGPGALNKAIRRSGGKMDYWELRPYLPVETQGYVPAFIAVNYIMNYSAEHNLYPLTPRILGYEIDTIKVSEVTTFQSVATALEIPVEDLYYLNPAYKLSIIPQSGQCNTLVLPTCKIGRFISNEQVIYEMSKEKENLAYVNAKLKTIDAGKTYIVKKGETLAKIAAKYKCTVYDLKEWNRLKSTAVHKGQRLSVFMPPGGETASSKTKKDSKNANTPISKNTRYIYYTVQQGDTLWKIANNKGISVEKLKELNNLHDNNSLKAGMKIKVGGA